MQSSLTGTDGQVMSILDYFLSWNGMYVVLQLGHPPSLATGFTVLMTS